MLHSIVCSVGVSLSQASRYIIVFAFGATAAAHLAGLPIVRRAYREAGFPTGFHYVVGLLELLTAIFIAMEVTLIWGDLLATGLILAHAVSLWGRRRFAWSSFTLALLVMLVFANIRFPI